MWRGVKCGVVGGTAGVICAFNDGENCLKEFGDCLQLILGWFVIILVGDFMIIE